MRPVTIIGKLIDLSCKMYTIRKGKPRLKNNKIIQNY